MSEASSLSERFEKLSTDALLELSKSNSRLDRARALEALAKRLPVDETLLDFIAAEVASPKNMEARIMGTISVSHIGVGALLRGETTGARKVVARLLQEWPEPDRSDLLWYLNSESLSAPR